jgi:hypothetical protein
VGALLRPRGLLPRLLAQARQQPSFELTRPEPHPAGAVLGLAGMLAGVLVYRSEGPWRDTLGAAALGVVLLGLALHGLWRRPGTGWRVDVAARRLEPLGQRGDAVVLDGPGWSIATAPGERRSHVAIDLRHADRGRVARPQSRHVRHPATHRRRQARGDRGHAAARPLARWRSRGRGRARAGSGRGFAARCASAWLPAGRR